LKVSAKFCENVVMQKVHLEVRRGKKGLTAIAKGSPFAIVKGSPFAIEVKVNNNLFDKFIYMFK